jgi:hypothetical protein
MYLSIRKSYCHMHTLVSSELNRRVHRESWSRINVSPSVDVYWHRECSVRDEGHVSASKRQQALAVGRPARSSAVASAWLQRTATRAASISARSHSRQRMHSHGGERSLGAQWRTRHGCSEAIKTRAFRRFHALRYVGGARGGNV